jgi:hypothetical protein
LSCEAAAVVFDAAPMALARMAAAAATTAGSTGVAGGGTGAGAGGAAGMLGELKHMIAEGNGCQIRAATPEMFH